MGIRSILKIPTRLRPVARRLWPPSPKPLILMYHRIADEPVDYWGLAVSPSHFEEHLQVLRRTRHPVPLAEFVSRLTAGTLPSNAVAVTFDDGYVDNLMAGKPLLASADIRATVFLTTGLVGRLEPLWWDELSRLILLAKGPQKFDLTIRGKSLTFDFGFEVDAGDNTAPCLVPKNRSATLSAIWQILRQLEDKERDSVMAQLRSILLAVDDYDSLARVMTSNEVQTIVSDGLVTIGAHTVNHPMLSGLEGSACRREIVESKRICEDITGRPVITFAYPYGDFDVMAREAVKTAGFALACSTRSGPATAASDIFALPRVHVPNRDGDEFDRILRSVSAET